MGLRFNLGKRNGALGIVGNVADLSNLLGDLLVVPAVNDLKGILVYHTGQAFTELILDQSIAYLQFSVQGLLGGVDLYFLPVVQISDFPVSRILEAVVITAHVLSLDRGELNGLSSIKVLHILGIGSHSQP